MRQKRIITLQDLSCFGKCSLTVAHPILSVMGLEACPVPTAVLSAHSGLAGWTYRDLTSEMIPIARHWKSLGLTFDTISVGYLGGIKQLQEASDFLQMFPNAVRIIDPAFADKGKFYAGFDREYASKMVRLCRCADVLVPNLMEAAAMLCGDPAIAGHSKADVHDMLYRLTSLGCRIAVVTGVTYKEEDQGVVAYDASSGEFIQYFRENLNVSLYGTGDIFAAVLAGAITLGWSLEKAIRLSVDYIIETIKATLRGCDGHGSRVRFEECLPWLIRELEKNKKLEKEGEEE